MNTPVMARELRKGAQGVYDIEAGVELLLRAFGGRFAQRGWPWVLCSDKCGHWFIDPEEILAHMGALSGGEQRVLMVAAGLLGAAVPVSFSELLTGLDRVNVALVLAAIAHAAGSHEHSDIRVHRDGSLSFEPLGSLHPWPASEAADR